LASSTLLTRPAPPLTSAIQLTSSTNIVVEWLAFLLHIWEVMGSNFGLETEYPDWDSSHFLQSHQENAIIISFPIISYNLMRHNLAVKWTNS
jgi:hypothetical protein